MTAADPVRRAEIEAGLSETRARIENACAAAGRKDLPTLIVVTKTHPPADIDHLRALGVRDIGENRDNEAAAKLAHVQNLDELTVHFIGQLQTNKAASVARYADVVHSVDRPRLVQTLVAATERLGRTLDVLIQVDLSGSPGRGGVDPQQAGELAALVVGAETLRLRGVMAVAPLDEDPDAAFARLAAVADGIRRVSPEATWISAGMSGDLEAAVRHGATHLRVGTAILGSRAHRG